MKYIYRDGEKVGDERKLNIETEESINQVINTTIILLLINNYYTQNLCKSVIGI